MHNLAVVVSNEGVCSALDVVDSIKEAGFKKCFIQWYNRDYPVSQNEVLEYIKKQGLEILFAHLSYDHINDLWQEGEDGDRLIREYKNDLDNLKKCGINMVISHLTSHFEAPKYSELGLKRIRDLAAYAKNLDMKIAFENTKIKGYMEYVLSNIKEENVGFCLDSGHLHAHFNDEFNFDIVKNRIFAVHLHDNFGKSDEHLNPFDGNINWDFIIDKLIECNYNGPITMELCYSDFYASKITHEEFYKKGFECGIKLEEMYNNKKR